MLEVSAVGTGAGDRARFFRCRSAVEVCALSLHDVLRSFVSKAELSLCAGTTALKIPSHYNRSC